MFDSTKDDLKDILQWADKGRLQLPDFQRDYVWGDEDLRSLIASVAKGYPVGALLTLETGGDVNFKPRVLEGVVLRDEVVPEQLLLDGQQRITSLYQALFSDHSVRTRTPKGMHVDRYYYLDIKKALESGADIGDAIISVPGDKVIRTNFGRDVERDLSTREAEFENDFFPLNHTFDSRDWFYDWRDYWRGKDQVRDVGDLERDFYRGFVERIERYKMPIIRLDRKNSREAICLVFEKVNVGGKKLDAFELVTAIYAGTPPSGFDLRGDWNGPADKSAPGRKERIIGSPNRCDVLSKIANTDFLQACSLMHTREQRLEKVAEGMEGKELPQVSCRRDALLALPLEAYKKHASLVEEGFREAGRFLNEHKIIWHKDIPYPPQIVVFATTFAIMGREAQNAAAKEKLARWFWTVTLGELYGSATESRMSNDVLELVEWISGKGPQPRSMDVALFQKDRLKSLRTRVSSAYKGLHALQMLHGCRDFITGKPTDLMTFFNDKIDIHHIFPKAWCKKQGIQPAVFDSIINKTPLSKASNGAIGGAAPSVYLRRIEENNRIEPSDLDAILESHLIVPEHLRNDDFRAFYEARMEALSGVVAKAMGKPVVQEHGANETEWDEGDDQGEDLDNEVEMN
ncbi:MAG: DUF262 domain-containing protein [Magnetococcales bacterium]|nr:DUF262 domain-containing protein [Magnetococcales bacterium]